VLLDVSDPATQLDHILIANIPVADDYLAAHWLDQAVEAPQQCRLSRPALAHQRRCTTGRHVQTYIAERDDVAKSM